MVYLRGFIHQQVHCLLGMFTGHQAVNYYRNRKCVYRGCTCERTFWIKL